MGKKVTKFHLLLNPSLQLSAPLPTLNLLYPMYSAYVLFILFKGCAIVEQKALPSDLIAVRLFIDRFFSARQRAAAPIAQRLPHRLITPGMRTL
jgi:hypothetical protein